MKRSTLTSIFLSLALTVPTFSVWGSSSEQGRRGGNGGPRTEQSGGKRGHSSQSRPGNGNSQSRPGNGNSQNRPGNGNSQNRPGNGGSQNRPGNGNSQNRPGNGNSQNRPGNGGGNSQVKPGNPGKPSHPGGDSYRPGGNNGHHNGNHGGPSYRPTPPPSYRPHPHYTGYRPKPSFGINVSFGGLNLFYSNGLYYNRYSPTQYVVTLPPIGLVVDALFNPVFRWVNDNYYYVSQGVVYMPVQGPYGRAYQVVDYLY